eukprot:TRINITY_DN1128_c1_g3_i1.p1 TRINITY_DN1128_c1_g3~~TRINITY_DN1128_c1_g3_i1.p1  ORF type:complete len:125 (+),score=2.15 TRINITY_DN1128_c1_g3_i1:79-453(+)
MIQRKIIEKLTRAFSPVHLEVINESKNHNVPKNSETHFKVIIVSDILDVKPRIEQHRSINRELSEELSTGVHALSIKTIKVSKWNSGQEINISESPKCLGGMKLEKKMKEQQQQEENDNNNNNN